MVLAEAWPLRGDRVFVLPEHFTYHSLKSDDGDLLTRKVLTL